MFIASIDQGTSSTRCLLFNYFGRIVASSQREHRQFYPQAGYVEHDANEIWQNTQWVIAAALRQAGISADKIAALGITNQRETFVVWDKKSGQPLHNAIVWQDTRSAKLCQHLSADDGPDRFRAQTGLPIATYFSGPKIAQLLQSNPSIAQAVQEERALIGTIDSWLIWQLTGGLHITDVTNASRTLLFNLQTLDWDEEILAILGIPRSALPQVCASSQRYGETKKGGVFGEKVVIGSCLGDQHAALLGQGCFSEGEAKNTYGTGCFLLLNTGNRPIFSQNGLLTTIAYQLEGQSPLYALEGSVAIAGALVQWLRDNLGLIAHSADIEPLARTVSDNGDCYFVPAFSGLYAPYWQSSARGVWVGLTRYINKGHLARAVLEATAYQSAELVEAMSADSGVVLARLKVDGGMVLNELLMQFQADLLGVPVIRPMIAETTALGAAYAAGLAVGYWDSFETLRDNWEANKTWQPTPNTTAAQQYQRWKKAVTRTFDWVEC